MPMRIDPDAKIVQESRLTYIAAVKLLGDGINKRDGTIDQVKGTLVAKEAKFAESPLAIARLQPGNALGDIAPMKIYDLIRAGKLSLEQFLACVAVLKEPLGKFLGSDHVDSLCSKIEKPTPKLFVEFKDGVSGVDKLGAAVAAMLTAGALQAAKTAAA